MTKSFEKKLYDLLIFPPVLREFSYEKTNYNKLCQDIIKLIAEELQDEDWQETAKTYFRDKAYRRNELRAELRKNFGIEEEP